MEYLYSNVTIEERFLRLKQLMSNASFDVLALNPSPSLLYLSGLNFHLSERPTLFLFKPPDMLALILPRLELTKAKTSPLSIQSYAYNDDPNTWLGVFKSAFSSLGIVNHKLGIEPSRLRYLEIDWIKRAEPLLEFVSAENILGELRIQKDEHELAAMRQAVRIAQMALKSTLDQIQLGTSEREIAKELTIQLLCAGSDTELPFSPIVASGPNSANPHATPSDRCIKRGDLLLIDWGANYNGYC